jgi:hypothetical protein
VHLWTSVQSALPTRWDGPYVGPGLRSGLRGFCVAPRELILKSEGTRAVLKAADKNADYCYEKAHTAKERASKALSAGVRKFYLETEARWLRRAASCEHAERLAVVVARLSALRKIPFCPACDTPMQPNGVGRRAGLMEYHYKCLVCEVQKTIIEIDP